MYGEQLEFFSNEEEDLERIQEECRALYIKLTESFLSDPKYLIGSGNIAEVHTHPDNPKFCIKMISKETVNKEADQEYCSLAKEAKFLNVAEKIKGKARVPRPYLSAVLKKGDPANDMDEIGLQILIMEKLDAFSMRDVLEGLEEMPAGFDCDTYFKNLREYIEKMHEEGRIYHRDLHEGNIMVGENSAAYVIDFGSAIVAYNEEDSWPRNIQGGVKKIPTDESKLSTTEKMVRKKLGLTV